MFEPAQSRNKKWLVIAVVAGSLGIAVGTVLGVSVGRWSVPDVGSFLQIPVHASATHGQDNYSLATSMLDEDGEAVFFLDALTGDLKAAAINPRINGKFHLFYSRNIMNDFGPNKLKNPRFLMVSGRANFNRRSGERHALGAIYVMELTTGQCVAYTMTAPPGRATLRKSFRGEVIPLDKVEFRKVKVRPGGVEEAG